MVEPDRIYAGGYQYPIPLKHILHTYHIKTVLSLRERPDLQDIKEQDLVLSHGVNFRQIIIPYGVSVAEKLARVEEAVAVISEPANQPVFVHCWAGRHRTGV